MDADLARDLASESEYRMQIVRLREARERTLLYQQAQLFARDHDDEDYLAFRSNLTSTR